MPGNTEYFDLDVPVQCRLLTPNIPFPKKYRRTQTFGELVLEVLCFEAYLDCKWKP